MKRRTFFRSSMAAAVAATLPRRPAFAEIYREVSQSQGLPDVEAVRGDGGKVTLKGTALQELKGRLRGRLLLANNEGYDDARRVLNASIDKRPAVIVQVAGVADVRYAVEFAREHNLLLAVKCGGHSTSGQSTCNDGLMIDLIGLRGVRVDPAARRAWVAGGSLLGQVDHESLSYGLVTTLGTVSHTGVGGLTTGGGFGRVARRFGLAADNVMAVDVVTADGKLVHASKTENPDLYWGVRGGSGNFGIVTSFEFQLHPMQRRVVAGQLVYPIARARDVFSLYADYNTKAPDELYVDLVMAQPRAGEPGVALFSLCYSGPEANAERAIAPLRKLGTPIDDGIKAMDYAAVQRAGDVSDPRANGAYIKGAFISELSPRLIDTIISNFEGHPERGTAVFFQHGGGAIGRVPRNATAFPHRNAVLNMLTAVDWKIGTNSSEHVRWIKQYWPKLEPFTLGFYANDLSGEERPGAVYGDNYQRLVALKNKYDPTNLFRLNANVAPGGQRAG